MIVPAILILLSAIFAECREYCWEAFNATCGPDEAVLVESARYGRMRVGRCLTREYYIGCSADIVPYLDRKCSGRHDCQFDVPDTELHKVQPCPKDLMAYMEASYSCVKVARGQSRHCQEADMTLTSKTGYIGNSITETTGQGSKKCPWTISVPPGQQINITLFDFAVGGNHLADSHICNMYATIREHSASQTEVTVCGGTRRRKPIYMSETNEVQVEIMTNWKQSVEDDVPYFLLKYEAVGCRDMKPPDHGWAERKGERLTISCNHTGEVWHLICDGNQWIGDFRNCTSATAKIQGTTPFVRNSLPLGLIVAVVIGIALGVALGMLLLALVLTCQRRMKRKSQATTAPASSRSCESIKTRIARGEDYGYAHVWELQQLRSGHAGDCEVKDAPQTTSLALAGGGGGGEPEFGHHLLLKCPKGNLNCREHPYESPVFVKRDHVDVHVVPSYCRGLDAELRNQTMPRTHKMEDTEVARYSH